METTKTTYHLNTRELDPEFLTTLREAFPDRIIEVTVREVDPYKLDADTYLRLYKTNYQHLLEAIENVRQGKNLVTFETVEEVIKYAEAYATCKKAAQKAPAVPMTEAVAS